LVGVKAGIKAGEGAGGLVSFCTGPLGWFARVLGGIAPTMR
jgi:hypothetical protein